MPDETEDDGIYKIFFQESVLLNLTEAEKLKYMDFLMKRRTTKPDATHHQ